MTKDRLLITIENYNRGLISFDAVETDVDRYSSALLQQTTCTTLLPGCQAHYFVQKDQNWLSCAHCGMLKPIGQ
jgi:hypothetical protein